MWQEKLSAHGHHLVFKGKSSTDRDVGGEGRGEFGRVSLSVCLSLILIVVMFFFPPQFRSCISPPYVKTPGRAGENKKQN